MKSSRVVVLGPIVVLLQFATLGDDACRFLVLTRLNALFLRSATQFPAKFHSSTTFTPAVMRCNSLPPPAYAACQSSISFFWFSSLIHKTLNLY